VDQLVTSLSCLVFLKPDCRAHQSRRNDLAQQIVAIFIWQGLRKKADALGSEMEQELHVRAMPIRRAVFWLVVGLVSLIVSSRILVWGAVEIAHGFGVSFSRPVPITFPSTISPKE
jgi:Ca2+/Na+ antiporter